MHDCDIILVEDDSDELQRLRNQHKIDPSIRVHSANWAKECLEERELLREDPVSRVPGRKLGSVYGQLIFFWRAPQIDELSVQFLSPLTMTGT